MEDYKKKYEDALLAMKQKVEAGDIDRCHAESIFSELKESKDESLRKELIKVFKSYQNSKVHINPDVWEGLKINDILRWLENQKQKDNEIVILKDKIGSLISAREAMQETHKLELENVKTEDERIREWLIEDLKDSISSDNMPKSYKDNAKEAITWLEKQKHNKFLIDDAYHRGYDKGVKDTTEKQSEQNYARWSEEDERHLNSIIKRTVAYGDSSIYGLIKDDIDWLKFLKGRVQSKQEWNEEDIKMVIKIKEAINDYFPFKVADEIYKWIKTLNPQPQR